MYSIYKISVLTIYTSLLKYTVVNLNHFKVMQITNFENVYCIKSIMEVSSRHQLFLKISHVFNKGTTIKLLEGYVFCFCLYSFVKFYIKKTELI